MQQLEDVHKEAVAWATGISPSSKRFALSYSIAALPPPIFRMTQLGMALSYQLHNSAHLNPIHHYVHSPDIEFPYENALLPQIRQNEQHQAFIEYNETAPEHNLEELSHQEYLRNYRRHHFETQCGKLPALLAPSARKPVSLVDYALCIPDRRMAHQAMRWRAGMFGMQFRKKTQCLCGDEWNRGHAGCLLASSGLVENIGMRLGVSEEETEQIRKKARKELKFPKNQYMSAERLMDFLLGDKKYQYVGVNTLSVWCQFLDL